MGFCFPGTFARKAAMRMGILVLAASAWAQAQEAATPTPLTIIRSQHFRLALPSDIQRIAVGNSDIVSAEPLNNRELLLLGKSAGRTSLLVWFRDGTIREYLCTVHRDLSLLQGALKRIYPTIEAEIAPDRDAVVLTGTVPDVNFLRAAEAAAHNYLDAAQINVNGRVLIQDQQQPAAPAQPTPPQPGQPPAAGAAPTDTIRLPAFTPASGTVINLIQVENLPPLTEQKIAEAVRGIGGADVSVRRILRGQVRDDSQDLFLLEGRVPTQVALTRVLTLAAHVVTGQVVNEQDIRVIADEAGALTTQVTTAGGGSGAGGFGGGGGSGVSGLGGGGVLLNNQVRKNIARAKVLQAGGGRILSFLEVADLPQVRVDIRLFEVDRSKLKTYSPNISTILGSPNIGSLIPSAISQTLQNKPNPVGPGNAVQHVLGFLGGSLVNETQLTTSHFALDAVLSYLEQIGVARSLSSPSLTVLSGEQALFQIGGDIPVPQAFAPALGGTAAGTLGVFSSVQFLTFGVELDVRPLVGDDDMLTLDILPQVTTPDTTLTASLRQNTGTNPLTTAFQTRSLRTSARLQDGQALIIGGLLSRTTNDTQASTPGLRDVPGFGWLFKNLNRTDDSTELIVVVNPAIVRDPLPNVGMWEYPAASELLDKFGKGLRPPLAGGTAGGASRQMP